MSIFLVYCESDFMVKAVDTKRLLFISQELKTLGSTHFHFSLRAPPQSCLCLCSPQPQCSWPVCWREPEEKKLLMIKNCRKGSLNHLYSLFDTADYIKAKSAVLMYEKYSFFLKPLFSLTEKTTSRTKHCFIIHILEIVYRSN